MPPHTQPARGMRDFLAGRHAPARIRHRRRAARLRTLWLRAARDARTREHRDADGEVWRRRQQADLQGASPRRARDGGRNRPCASLRSDRPAGACGRGISAASCRNSSSGIRFSRSGAPTVPRAAGSASSISATSMQSDRGHRSWKPSCAPRSPMCSGSSDSPSSSFA